MGTAGLAHHTPVKRIWGGSPAIVSRRDAADLTSLDSAVHGLLDKAVQGIDVADLMGEAQQIAQMAEAIGEASGAEVDISAVKDVIDAVAKQSDGATAVSALFEGPLDFDASKMDAALHILDGLTARAQELQEAGDPLQNVMAAVLMTVAAMENTCEDVVDIVIFLDALDQSRDSSAKKNVKRGWDANVGYTQGGGISAGVSYSRRR